jgi:hypothetical protein
MNQRAVMSCAAVVALTGVVASGCGGGGDNRPSKSDYIKQADAICTKDSKKLNAVSQKKFKTKPTPKQFAQFVKDDFVPTIEDQLTELRKLKTPKSDQDKLSRIYDDADRGVQKLKADPTLLASGDPFKKANEGAQAYGLKVCGA